MAGLLDLLAAFHGKRVVVLGDLFLDEYVLGAPARISREAPIVILEFARRQVLPGGGAAPGCNIQSLGGQAVQVGVIGADKAGEELRAALDQRRRVTPTVRRGPGAGRRSSSRASWPRVRSGFSSRLPAWIRSTAALSPVRSKPRRSRRWNGVAGADALLISDYASGTVRRTVVDAARRICARLVRRSRWTRRAISPSSAARRSSAQRTGS